MVFMPNVWVIFATGLLAGGLSCMVVQGGLLATTIAQYRLAGSRSAWQRAWPILSFLAAKLVVYTLLGFLLGWLGSLMQITLRFQAILMIAVALFMIGTALALMDVHPMFRFFILEPPAFLRRLVRRQSKQDHWFAPAILGAFTIFIPCGTTQAMMALAIASGSPVWGALILFTFVLGTSPLFFFVGYSMEWLKTVLASRFAPIAASVIIIMAVWNMNAGAILLGSPVSVQSVAAEVYCTVTFCDRPVLAFGLPSQQVTITIESNGYRVDSPAIPAGKQISLTLKNENGRGCTQAFTIPKLGISQVVPVGQTKTISFTAPEAPGTLAYSCGMGMYGGQFTIL